MIKPYVMIRRPLLFVCRDGKFRGNKILLLSYHSRPAGTRAGRWGGAENAKENWGAAEMLDGQSLENETIVRIFLKKMK
ncbi:MAG: hypothetical protein MR483_07535 [Bacteroidales bacterium]|nr:hypothetical protein [Bacteroidales bacterium]